MSGIPEGRMRGTAKILRLGKMSVYEAVSRGEIPYIRIGRRILIPRNVLERMLDNLGSVPKAAA
jgi:excisionase family DNA binding protein